MGEEAIVRYITDSFAEVEVTTIASGDHFFCYDPERKFPFATLVTSDAHDDASDLDRPGVFRLNIGVRKERFLALFGAGEGDADAAPDYTALDRLLPHPVYGRMHWVCILNPSDATFAATVQPLLAEAYALHVERYARRKARD